MRVCARERPQSANVPHRVDPLQERRICMTCGYCRYPNSDEEHRCRRCGRPLSDSYAVATAGALAAVPLPARREPAPAAPPAPQFSRPPRQGLLFQEKPSGKVIPFEALTSPASQPAPPPKPKPVTRTSTRIQTRRAEPSGDTHSLRWISCRPLRRPPASWVPPSRPSSFAMPRSPRPCTGRAPPPSTAA